VRQAKGLKMEAISKYKYTGMRVDVFNNGLEFVQADCLLGKKEMIIFRNIASIERHPLLACIDIKTNHGKNHRIPVAPGDIVKLKEQIESLL
jgi:hypothetical protein